MRTLSFPFNNASIINPYLNRYYVLFTNAQCIKIINQERVIVGVLICAFPKLVTLVVMCKMYDVLSTWVLGLCIK